MKSHEFVKNVHVSQSVTAEEGHLEDGRTRVSKSVGPNSRGRPLGRWKNRVKSTCVREVLPEGGRLDQARRECLDSKRQRLFCCGHPFWGTFLEERKESEP